MLEEPKAAAPAAALEAAPAEEDEAGAPPAAEELEAPPAVAEVVRLREEATEEAAAAMNDEATAVLLLTVATPLSVCDRRGWRGRGGGKEKKSPSAYVFLTGPHTLLCSNKFPPPPLFLVITHVLDVDVVCCDNVSQVVGILNVVVQAHRLYA